MMRCSALAMILVLAAEPRAGGAARFQGLAWIPADAEVILGFEDPDPAAATLAAPMREALLFATRMDGQLSGLWPAADLGAGKLVTARVPLPDGGKGVVALAGDTVAAGDPAATLRCRSVRNGRGESVLTSSALRPLLDEISSQGEAWGLLLPGLVGLPEAPRLPYRGVRDALAGIRWSTVSARLTSSAAFRMRTRTASDDDAFVLADALRAFLASFRLNADGAPAVSRALEASRVRAEGSTVLLELDLSGEALGRLRRSEASRQLLSWRLGAEEREVREKVGEVLARLDLPRGGRVADVGCGLGFYTVALARTVGEAGRVFAVDVDERVLHELRRRVTEAPFPQVEVVLGAPDDPKLTPDTLDAILVVNSYHEMPRRRQMLEHMWRALKPGGRLALVEPFSRSRRSEPRQSQEESHLIAPEILEADLRDAGFEILSRVDEFVSGKEEGRFESFLLGRRPPAHITPRLWRFPPAAARSAGAR